MKRLGHLFFASIIFVGCGGTEADWQEAESDLQYASRSGGGSGSGFATVAGGGSSGSAAFAAPTRTEEVDCTDGQTADDCCEGIDYCACLYNPLGGNTPLACFSSPPSSGSNDRRTRGGSGSFTTEPREEEVECTDGQTVDDCCEGIDYCACLHDPFGGSTPLACFSSPPPSND